MIVRKAEILVFLQKAAAGLSQADDALLDLLHPLAESAVSSFLQQDLGYKQHIEILPCGPIQRERGYPLDHAMWRGGSVVFPTLREGTDMLQLKHLPVWNVGLEVREDLNANAGQGPDAFATSSILVQGTDYFLDVDDAGDAPVASPSLLGLSRTGILRRIGAWPVAPRSIKVTYYGGIDHSHMANDGFGGALKLATLLTITSCFQNAVTKAKSSGLGPLMSEDLGSYKYQRDWRIAAASTDSFKIAVPVNAQELLQPFRNYGRLFA